MIDRTPDQAHGESQFISMADMMTGFLFIFIILLMFFVLQHREELTQKREELAQTTEELAQATKERDQKTEELAQITEELAQSKDVLTQSRGARDNILEAIVKKLKEKGVADVDYHRESGVIRLPDGLLFESGSADIKKGGLEVVQKLADAMAEVLPCYVKKEKEKDPQRCKSARGELNTVLVEGHADSDPLAKDNTEFRDNWELSSVRAMNTYREIRRTWPNDTFKDILGVSGYGESRTIKDVYGKEDKDKSRRIDLRFIMAAPGVPEAAERTADSVDGATIPGVDRDQ